ncbi:SNAP receptor [Saccharomycopsis crataegensis]|uniref:SNAP receptor n=1 Tax=Saccharomycopsis crataegensis TaxID=43959 RepID=A0AAV5QJ83_9ASCO|nr:SNAP receptor [Saccharomycopsis crataegensis]
MSLIEDLEANDPTTSFNAIIEQVSGRLFQINSNINNVKKLQTTLTDRSRSQLPTSNHGSGNKNLQNRITELVDATNALFHELNEPKTVLVNRYVYHGNNSYMDNLGTSGYRDDVDDEEPQTHGSETLGISKTQNLQKSKILREVSSSLMAFQNAQEEFKQFITVQEQQQKQLLLEEEEQILKENNGSMVAHQSTIVKELDPINNAELVHHIQLVSQREEEIQHIESSISELNTIFQDLDSLVTEQGYMVDNIETNLNSASDNVRAADRELRKASNSQKRSLRTKKCLMSLCAVVLFVLMILVLALT